VRAQINRVEFVHSKSFLHREHQARQLPHGPGQESQPGEQAGTCDPLPFSHSPSPAKAAHGPARPSIWCCVERPRTCCSAAPEGVAALRDSPWVPHQGGRPSGLLFPVGMRPYPRLPWAGSELQVFMIDFGLAREYRDPTTHQHIPTGAALGPPSSPCAPQDLSLSLLQLLLLFEPQQCSCEQKKAAAEVGRVVVYVEGGCMRRQALMYHCYAVPVHAQCCRENKNLTGTARYRQHQTRTWGLVSLPPGWCLSWLGAVPLGLLRCLLWRCTPCAMVVLPSCSGGTPLTLESASPPAVVLVAEQSRRDDLESLRLTCSCTSCGEVRPRILRSAGGELTPLVQRSLH